MKQDKQESNDDEKFIEQDTLGPPGTTFEWTPTSEQLVTISGILDGSIHFTVPTYHESYAKFI